jgi:hypothetical protein
MMNHHEWYMSKKPRDLYSFTFAGLIWAIYSWGGIPCGTTVPMIEMSAREINRNIVSFNEQKKSQIEFRKSLFWLITDLFSFLVMGRKPYTQGFAGVSNTGR